MVYKMFQDYSRPQTQFVIDKCQFFDNIDAKHDIMIILDCLVSLNECVINKCELNISMIQNVIKIMFDCSVCKDSCAIDKCESSIDFNGKFYFARKTKGKLNNAISRQMLSMFESM